MFDEKNQEFNENNDVSSDNKNFSSDLQSDEASEQNKNSYTDNEVISEIDITNIENAVSSESNVPFSQQPLPVTQEDPVVPIPDNSAAESNTHNNYGTSAYGGVVYNTSGANGENTTCCSWNLGKSFDKTSDTKAGKSSSKGFRIFIASILTVFTASVVTLTVMVAHQIFFENKAANIADGLIQNHSENSSSQHSQNLPSSSQSQNVSASSHYVVYDASIETEGALSIPQIAAKCSPSSVGVVSQYEVSYSYPFGFGTNTSVSEASGSGFIYSSDGYIITNHHVIEDAIAVKVILHDGTEYSAQIIGSDSLSDIAVLKIEPDSEKPLVPMEIGNSDKLVVGESVVAIGCPAGMKYIGTVTDGIISAINRNVEISDQYGTTQKTMTLIQTNATINHGNSGGPLINSKGQVIGINTLKLSSSSYEGIGFSIPMNGAMPIISQLIEHGKVIERTEDDFAYGKGVIGITGSPVTEDEAEYYNIPMGVLVIQIDKGSSAAKAGLRRGDIITHYNGKSVKDVNDINEAKGNARAGETVTVTVYRDKPNGNGDGETVDITFKLDSQK